jgi:outer membrane protein OmpA-like peptidoglycan-associated protein
MNTSSDLRYNVCNMSIKKHTKRLFSALLVIAALAGCATEKSTESQVLSKSETVLVTSSVALTGIETTQRALPTVVTNATQKAHYDHVYIDSKDADARSLRTIPLVDAVANNVLASNPKPVIRQELDPSKLTWFVTDKGDKRPTSLEGVGGYGIGDGNYVEVNFDVDKTLILNPDRVQFLVDKAKRVSGMFYVVGYADETGIESKNETLSKNRAVSVKEMLTEANIHSTRIVDAGAGVSRTYPDLASNRRVSITFKADQQP